MDGPGYTPGYTQHRRSLSRLLLLYGLYGEDVGAGTSPTRGHKL